MKRLLLPLLALVACAPAVLPLSATVPNPIDLQRVLAERVEIPGFAEQHTPDALNKALFVRYSLPKTGKASAVIVLMPGFLGGVSNFDRLARNVVSLNPSLEVWAVDRRSNLLEDHRVLDAAYRQRDPLIAWAHHIRDASKPDGFKPLEAKDVAFMGYWGLQVHLEDLRRVVQLARGFGGRVILGGHSLGAAMVSLYAGWDFAGTPGFKDLDGLLLLDGVAGRTGTGAGVTKRDYEDGLIGPFGIRGAGRATLEAGTGVPFFSAMGFDPAGLARLSAGSLLAALDPNGDSPSGVVPYAASNLAAAMAAGDNNYALVSAFSISGGYARNATVAINALGYFVGNAGVLSITGVQPDANRVEWQSPAANDFVELTDPEDFTQRFYNPLGDYQEWYFPVRLSLDIGAAGLVSPSWAQSLRVRHIADTKLPMLAVIGGRGIVTTPDAFKPLEAKMGRAIERRELPQYTHLDVLSARFDTLARWVAEFAVR